MLYLAVCGGSLSQLWRGGQDRFVLAGRDAGWGAAGGAGEACRQPSPSGAARSRGDQAGSAALPTFDSALLLSPRPPAALTQGSGAL